MPDQLHPPSVCFTSWIEVCELFSSTLRLAFIYFLVGHNLSSVHLPLFSYLICPLSPAGAAVATPLSDLLREVYDVSGKQLTPQVCMRVCMYVFMYVRMVVCVCE